MHDGESHVADTSDGMYASKSLDIACVLPDTHTTIRRRRPISAIISVRSWDTSSFCMMRS